MRLAGKSGEVRRSPADLLRLVAATIGLVGILLFERLFGDALVEFGADLLRGLDALPSWITGAVLISTRLLWLVVIFGGLAHSVAHHRWRMLAMIAVAAVAAAILLPALDALVTSDEGEPVLRSPVDAGLLTDTDVSILMYVAAIAAGLTAAAPWLSRRWRRAGWATTCALMLAVFLAAPFSFDAALALMVGWFCGAAVLVVAGAPSRRPTRDAVIAGLSTVGVPLANLEPASVDARGSTPYLGASADGRRLFVKVLGADERSADLLFRLYRKLQPRDLGDARAYLSLQRTVEHEALVSLVARNVGVRTPRIVAIARAEPNGHVLAYEAIEGTSLDHVTPEHVTDAVLLSLWGLVRQLHANRIAHRDLRLANLFLDEAGDVWLIDFGFGELTASDLLLATDVAELVASSSTRVGAERAIDCAAEGIGVDALSRAVGRLRPWALSGATRKALKANPGQLDVLRARIAQAVMAGTVGLHPRQGEPPSPARR